MQPQQKTIASISVQDAQQSPRRWYQFGLKGLLIFTAYIALAVLLNTRPLTVIDIGKGFARFTRGFPLAYFDEISEEHQGKPVIYVDPGTGWIDNPLPAVSNWSKFCANALILAVMFCVLWIVLPWVVRAVRSVFCSLWQSSRGTLRPAMIPAAVLGFLGVMLFLWGARVSIVITYYWLEEYLGNWVVMGQRLGELGDVIRPLSAVSAGIVLVVAARMWLLGHERKILISLAAMGMIIIVSVLNMAEFTAGRTEQFTWPIGSAKYEFEER